ncbi:PA14 domain-containing protein, partial [Ligaoa zhengdingensis]
MRKKILAWLLSVAMLAGNLTGLTVAHAVEGETDPSPVLYYTFDNVKGTVVKDASGNGNDGYLLNGAGLYNDAEAGPVMILDNPISKTGSNTQAISLPTRVFKSMEDLTLVIDVKAKSFDKMWCTLLGAGTNTSNYMVMAADGTNGRCFTNATKLNGGVEQRISAGAGVKAKLNEWTRLAFTHTADGQAKLFINDEQVASGTLSTTIPTLAQLAGAEIRVGGGLMWPDPGVDGRFDNLRIYDQALTEDQLKAIPALEKGEYEEGPLEPDPAEEVPFPEFPELGDHGLRGDFYLMNKGDLSFGEYKGTYFDENIAFSDAEGIIQQRTGASDYVAARWTGRFVAPEDGNYTFSIYSDNGVRLWVDGELLIDWWVNQWDVEQFGVKQLALKAGEPHDIQLEWFEYSGGSHVTLYWKNDNSIFSKQAIPAAAFYRPVDFEGALVAEMDTSGAQLDRGEENFGGTIALTGSNLGAATALELISYSGTTMAKPVYLDFEAVSDTELRFELPTDTRAGVYKVKVTANGIITASDGYFAVVAAPGESDRPEHPRPDWYRSKWESLNGWWNFTLDEEGVGKTEEWFKGDKDVYDLKINVPFPWESPMSGVGANMYRGEAWYERELTLDESWEGQEVFIRFGAVDWKSTLYIDGVKVGDHEGGYTPFEYDITQYVTPGKTHRLTLWVEDRAIYNHDEYPALVGKQGLEAPCGYTHTSGIWQDVILEGRTKTYLDFAHANPDIANSSVQFDIGVISDTAKDLTVKFGFVGKKWDEEQGVDILNGSSFSGEQAVKVDAGVTKISLDPTAIADQKLWDFDDANLYYGTFELYDGETLLDSVDTYFGQREVTADFYHEGNEYKYLMINGEPTFLSGLLDQGFWPEGVYTAPSEEALKYDIKKMKDLGFNMIRKHLKIEDPLQYYWCDKLGFFVWQDMPHATYMNAKTTGGETPGRVVYEYALESMIKRDYNHPSVIAVMLFNETWGISKPGLKASDGMTTEQWQIYLYGKTKELNPNLLVEDMSPCNNDHIQPTDLNTYHFYTGGYQNSKNTVNGRNNATYIGSSNNFRSGYVQDGAPWLNSEYGGVGAGAGDLDVSWCFKHQTDIQRQYQKLNGYVYTEPYDIEWERNGILSYDRRDKIFAYGEIAYGGDMTMADLNQPDYIGVDVNPALKKNQGETYSAPIVVMNWSGMQTDSAVVKWRFDATDVYGNYITTGISGESPVDYKPYTREEVKVTFDLPNEKCVGTLTVWLEVDGVSIAKNFVNVIVTNGKASPSVDYIGENNAVMRGTVDGASFVSGTGSVDYRYPAAASFDLDTLDSLRIIAEVSSYKEATTNYGINNSDGSQTTEGSERPSDLTILVNGVEIDTVYLPDNPRDIRGTLTLLYARNGGSSADNFGYLVNVRVPDDKLNAVKEAIAANGGEIVVSYAVKDDAVHKNGVRMYTDTTGRYAVDPMIILNPTDVAADAAVTPESGNYTAEATLEDGGSISVRGGLYRVALSGGVLSLNGEQAVVGEGEHLVAVKLFDDHIQVYADNDPVPVIDIYDYSEYTDNAVAVAGGSGLVVAPETYIAGEDASVAQADVQYVDHFNRDGSGGKNTTFETRYTLLNGGTSGTSGSDSEGVWDVESGDELAVELDWGNKAVINGTVSSDVIAEGDFTITALRNNMSIPNMGFIVRGSNYTPTCDGANGYYAGIGIQDGNGFIQVGRMDAGVWNELANVKLGAMSYGETHRLKVVAVGPRIRVYLDDETEPRVDVYDSTYTEGSVAIRGFNVKGVIDNIVVSTAPRYEADFENENTSEWTKTTGWSIENGELTASTAAVALVGNLGWTDYEYVADVTPAADNAVVGLALRGDLKQNHMNGYYVALDAEADRIQVIKVTAGVPEVLDEADLVVDSGATYELKVRAVNNGIRVYVDGDEDPVLKVIDNSYFNGKAGVAVIKGAGSFDNVVVKDKFIFEDEFADGALDGWNIVSGTMSVADNTLKIERKSNGDKLWDGYATWSDYTIKARVKLDVNPNSKSNAGYVFRASDLTTGTDNLRGFVMGLNSSESSTNPLEKSGIEFGDIHYGWRAIANTQGDVFTFDPSQWYDFEVSAIGNAISVTVDGTKYYTKLDDAYTYGMFGIRVFNSGLQVQNLMIIPGDEVVTEGNKVTVVANENAKIAADMKKAAAGDVVTVDVSNVAADVTVTGLKVTGADESAIEVTQVTEGLPLGVTYRYTFVMPDQAVKVELVIDGGEADAYAVNVAEVTGATVTADKAEAAEGETVTVTIADIEEGKEFE